MSGSLFVVAAPSGAGKTSLVKALLSRELSLLVSISHTTRAARPGEREGVDYFFIDRETFQGLRARGHFLETAEVYGNFYGTSAAWLQEQLNRDHDVIVEIDWQGALQVKSRFPDAVMIYILPPSIDVLAARLKSRGQDSAQVMKTRIDAAREDMSHVSAFEYVIINQEFSHALEELHAVVKSARLRRTRVLARHPALLSELTSIPSSSE